MAGSSRVGFRKPDVKGHESGLGPEADHGKNKCQACQGSAFKSWSRQLVKIQRWALMRQQDKENKKKGGADMRCDQVDPSGPSDCLVFIFKGDQKKSSQGHDFPCHEKQHAVIRNNNQGHAGNQDIEKQPRGAQVFPVSEVPQIRSAVDGGNRGEDQYRK